MNENVTSEHGKSAHSVLFILCSTFNTLLRNTKYEHFGRNPVVLPAITKRVFHIQGWTKTKRLYFTTWFRSRVRSCIVDCNNSGNLPNEWLGVHTTNEIERKKSLHIYSRLTEMFSWVYIIREIESIFKTYFNND